MSKDVDDRQARKESEIASAVKIILLNIGENPDREGLIRTPLRFAKAIQFLTHGYSMNPESAVHDAVFAG
jgi:GTP cyclohydrolase IA